MNDRKLIREFCDFLDSGGCTIKDRYGASAPGITSALIAKFFFERNKSRITELETMKTIMSTFVSNDQPAVANVMNHMFGTQWNDKLREDAKGRIAKIDEELAELKGES